MEPCQNCLTMFKKTDKRCIFCNTGFTSIFLNERHCDKCDYNLVCDNCDILSWKTRLIYIQTFDQNLKHHKKLERERNRKNK
jgi:hypothetical protein